MKLSVIVPVYNVEEYIEKCILSLEEQDIPHNEYEIIIINDGSPDNSREVILRLTKQFSNIVFIEQENTGVSGARNKGIEHARGHYVVFIDPDDYVEVNSFSRILKTAYDNRAQVAFLSIISLNEDNSIRKENLYTKEKGTIYTGINAYSISRRKGLTDPDRSVAILYELNFLNSNNLRNTPGIPYLEDGEFITRVLCLAEKCIFEGNSFYIRTNQPGSATNSNLFYSDRATNGFMKAAQNLFQFQQTLRLTLDQKIFLNQPICKFVILTLNSSIKDNRKFKSVVAKLKDNGLQKLNLEGCQNIYFKEGFFYNISPYLYGTYKLSWTALKSIQYKILKKSYFL